MASTARRALSAPSVDIDGVAIDHIRLMTKVARMYHEMGLRQPQIAEQLHLSQPRVSRLLKQAVDVGIVRTTVVAPRGVYSELERLIEEKFGLREVVIADTSDQNEEDVIPALGVAAAVYLEATLTGGDRIGISSWSSTLLATVDAMRPRPSLTADRVVQVLGGVGNVAAQSHATRLIGRLSQLTGAAGVYLPAPGLLASSATRQAFMADPTIEPVLREYDRLTTLLVGVGSLEPSPLLLESGNAVAAAEQEQLRQLGAVGDICLRFFDANGQHVASDLDDRVLGISSDTLRAVPRVVGVAGGQRKYTSIQAALRGKWLDVLITDLHVAQRLADS